MLDRLEAFLHELDPLVVGVHLDGVDERDAVVRLIEQAGRVVVGLEAHPRVVVTADGVAIDGVVRPLKDEVDTAVPDAEHIVVIRKLGDAALAPTLDAYLDVEMTPGRDVWLDEL